MGEAQEQSQSHVAEIEIEEGEIVEVAATTGDGSGGVSAPAPVPAPASMEHPLENSWTFWFQNPNGKSKQAAWGTSLRPVFTFNTVEDFWRLYNNILPPSKLVAGSDFHCFKEGIEPKWEDPKCANGGKWTILPTKTQFRIDAFWLNTLLAMIGEQFDDGDEICGAVISVRARQEKIALWTKNAANESVQVNIGRQWKDFLDYNEKIGYVFHDDSKKLEKLAKNRYNV